METTTIVVSKKVWKKLTKAKFNLRVKSISEVIEKLFEISQKVRCGEKK